MRSLKDDSPPPTHCGGEMARVLSAASFGFKTRAGNVYSFTPSHGRVTRGNRKPKTITRGDLGGKRPRARILPGPDGKVVIQ